MTGRKPYRRIMDATPSPRRMNPEARRTQLLVCAVRAFAARGLGRAAHADVAREARVSVPTVFVYFPTREDLVAAVLGEIERFLMDLIEKMGASSGEASDVLDETLWTFAESAETARDYVRVWLDWSTAIRDDVWPRYLDLQERIIGRVREVILLGQQAGTIQHRVDAEDAARIIVGEAHMVTLMMFGGLERTRIRLFVRHLVESALSIEGQGSNASANRRGIKPRRRHRV